MRRKMFGTYDNGGMVSGSQAPEEFVPSDQAKTNFKPPELFGDPLPNPQMKQKTMGDIFESKEDITPKDYAAQGAAKKRMRGFGKGSPMGPVTGMQGGQGGGQQGEQEEVSVGNRWLGELWQRFTEGEPAGEFGPEMGYQGGGTVNPAMDIYNDTIHGLESGIGFAYGGLVEQRGPETLAGPSYLMPSPELEAQADDLASRGRYGDSMMMHVNPAEVEALDRQGLLSINPETGQPEAFWPLVIGLVAGGLLGGATTDWSAEGIIGGAALGGVTGGLGMAAAAPVAPAVGAVETTGLSMLGPGGVALGESVVPGGAVVSGWGTAPTLGAGGLTSGEVAGLKAGISGISQLGGQEEPPRPQVAAAPPAPEPPMPERTPINVRKPRVASSSGLRGGSRGRIGNVLG